MRYPAEETAARHERILQEASRLFRERGINGVSLPEIMKAAQLTHGPFYNHFASKEALIAESLQGAMDAKLQRLLSGKSSKAALREYLDEYLSSHHRDNPGNGCVAPALAGEIARNSGSRLPFTQYIKDMLSAMSEKLAPEGDQKAEARAEALRILVGMVGAIALARAVEDKVLSDEILARTHADLLRGIDRGVRSSSLTARATRRSSGAVAQPGDSVSNGNTDHALDANVSKI
ncbi:MAG: TetR/AcrR family transcriptional regulator [Verrucomicrobia bacterium]|nr:TetR/AcrR family transcriptional regulator [Verrucomicrobiota bacterium]